MKCVKCGNENSDTFRFCQFCGTTLGEVTEGDSGSSAELPMSSISTPGSLDAWLIDEEDDGLEFTVSTEEEHETAAPEQKKQEP